MIVLERLLDNYSGDVPPEWNYRELLKFGLDWEIFDYQKRALENVTKLLFLTYKKTQTFILIQKRIRKSYLSFTNAVA